MESTNKQTLPALIIILNATPEHEKSRISDEKAATRAFFSSLKNETASTLEFAELAARVIQPKDFSVSWSQHC